MRTAALLASLALACSQSGDGARMADAAPNTSAIRAELVRWEALRDGVRLEALARHGDVAVRRRALLALGRVGGALAAGALRRALADPHEEVRTEAARGLGLLGDDATGALAQAYPKATPRARPIVLESLGRAGGDAALPVLSEALDDKEALTRASAARALGALGYRKKAIGPEVRAKLLAHAGDAEAQVRYAVTYALLRETPSPRDAAVEAVLVRLAMDQDPEVRALAIRALSARGVPKDDVFRHALDDGDWRVRVQAVRALSGEPGTPRFREVLADWLTREWSGVAELEARLLGPGVHPILEGLERLGPYAKEAPIQRLATALFLSTDVRESTERQRYTPTVLHTIDAVNCGAAALWVRGGGAIAKLLSCGEDSGAGWPPFKRRELLAQVVGEGAGGTLDARVALLRTLAQDPDARVRAAAISAAGTLADARAAKLLAQALGDANVALAGSAAEALAQAVEKGTFTDQATLDALVLRAEKDDTADVELRLTWLAALRAAKVPAAQGLCARAHADAHPALREEGRACLLALTGTDPGSGPPAPSPPLPPFAPGAPSAEPVVLAVATSKGHFVMELFPEVAPWNVATLTALAHKGFYAGTLWHRVVPDFVVQGGDPTGSGWGGPGFVVPAEPSGLHYERGTVGIADAGKDTGGSQFFVAHSRAPHLDGRYTIVGRVTEGMEVVDALLVGDTLLGVKVKETVP